jgi:hypothetical protein
LLHPPLKLFLQLCKLLLEGGHFVGGGILVFGDVVVFGMVVFGVLIVVAGFFIRVFISLLTSVGSGDAYAASLLRP